MQFKKSVQVGAAAKSSKPVSVLPSQGMKPAVKASPKITIPAKTVLTYNVAKENLSGYIDTAYFNQQVFSGGSRGHKEVKNAKLAEAYLHHEADSLMSHLATTKMKEKKVKGKKQFVQRGGAIPPGHYLCVYQKSHPTFKECIFLAQQEDALRIVSPFASMPIVHKRDGFFIHGAGPKGSDGCLVFDTQSEKRRKALNKAIKNFKGQVFINVINNSFMLPAEIGGYYT